MVQDGNPSVLSDNFKHHFVLVFDLTLIQDATENCHYPKPVGQSLMVEPDFTFPLEPATELIVLGERKCSVAVDKVVIVGIST